MACFSALSQPILRNTCTTNNPPTIAGSGIFGTITAQVANYSDKAQFVDTNVLALGVIAWAYDAKRLTIGDGATLGGVPLAIRYQTNVDVFSSGWTNGSRQGELGVLEPVNFPNIGNFNPYVMFTLNVASNGNWVPLIAVHTNFASLIGLFNTNTIVPQNPYEHISPLITVDSSTNGSGFDATNGFGLSGIFLGNAPMFQAKYGSGGNSVGTGQGGIGGSYAAPASPVFDFAGGNAGNATVNGSVGGNGGSAVGSIVVALGGNGGNSAFNGHTGGTGGAPGSLVIAGGNATDASAGADGLPGGNGGNIFATANATFNSGNITVSASGSRNGGSLTSFGSTFVPVVLFTTVSTAGPTNSAAETSLLGTAASFGNGTKTLGSNVVDHIGRAIRFHAEGELWDAATIPTLEIKLKVGTAVVLDTGAVTPTALTGPMEWSFDGTFTFRSLGSSGTGFGQGRLTYNSTTGQIQGISTAATATITVNTIADQTVDCTATWGAASVGNSIQCTAAYFELIN